MIIYILMFDDCVERASTDCRKMNELAAALNGGSDMMGPYDVISVELEDAPNPTQQCSGQKTPMTELRIKYGTCPKCCEIALFCTCR